MRILSVILLAFLPFCMSAQDSKSTAILDKMSAKYKALKSFQASFTYGAISSTGKAGRTSSGSILTKGTKFKLNMAGQEIFNNGKDLYTYVKETNEVNITSYDSGEDSPFSPTNIYTIYKKGYKYKFVKEAKSGSKTLEIIELVPEKRNNSVQKLELAINKADKSLENWKIWDSNGRITAFTVTSFKPNVPVSDATFAFNVKNFPGVEVIDLR